MVKKLAIIIPAYKHQFLYHALFSIANQTCKDFNLYIGDDASPNPIGEIVEEFRDRLNFVYKRFDQNLGAKSLVWHWKRCIEMTQGEEWLMILGDDDYLSENFVDIFYGNLPHIEEKDFKVVRFSVQIVNEVSKAITQKNEQPTFEKSTDSFFRMLNKENQSSLSEYVFRKDSFLKHGFKNFPLAWHSDDLAWMEFSEFEDIFSVNEATVFVRKTPISITGREDNFYQKHEASFLFFKKIVSDYISKFNLEQQKRLILALEFWMFKQKQFDLNNFKLLFFGFFKRYGLIRSFKFSYYFFQKKFSDIYFESHV